MLQSISIQDEKMLFAAIAKGDELAFTEIFKRYDKRLFYFALKMIKSEHLAEEITQEIFIKLWEKRGRLTEVENPEAYILTIAANHTINRIKKLLTERQMLDRLAIIMREKFGQDADELLLLHQQEEKLTQALGKLPPRQKEIYQLSRGEGLSYDEIADLLQLSRNTVRNHLVEALKAIRAHLGNSGDIPVALVVWVILLFKD